MKIKYTSGLVMLIAIFMQCTPAQVIVEKSCDTIGTVKDHTGLDGCKFLIHLENGKRLEPAIIDDENFKLRDGQKIKFSYEQAKDIMSICMGGELVKITCIEEIEKDKMGNVEPTEEFPESWEGKWSGELTIYNSKGIAQQLQMGLHILPVDTSDVHTFAIIYGQGEQQQVRSYEIFAKDASKGHYVTDEKNSIFLDDYLLGNTLYSRFEVMNNLILAVYRKEGEQITFDIISGSSNPINETGGEGDIPKVNSYGISNAQRAILTRE